jgi:hypothetical protein
MPKGNDGRGATKENDEPDPGFLYSESGWRAPFPVADPPVLLTPETARFENLGRAH